MPEARATPVLAVKSREGELEALANTSGINGKVHIMVELSGNLAPAGTTAKRMVAVATEAAISGHPLWFDTTWLTSDHPFGGSPDRVLEHLDHNIEEEVGERLPDFDGACLIPVVPADADQHQLRTASMLVEHQHRPAAVRVRDASSAHDLPRTVERIGTALGLAADELHVILDEGYTPVVHQDDADALARRINGSSGLECASITVLAGSTPRTRTTYETHTRERTEVVLWDAVQQRCDRALAYGDYGIVHPVPHTDDGPRFPPNPYIHYTVPRETLAVARRIPDRSGGVPPRGASEHYFLEVADELVGRPEFTGPKFSWGDRVLDSCRSTPIAPIGKSTKWIAFATSHHAAHLARRLDDAAA